MLSAVRILFSSSCEQIDGQKHGNSEKKRQRTEVREILRGVSVVNYNKKGS